MLLCVLYVLFYCTNPAVGCYILINFFLIIINFSLSHAEMHLYAFMAILVTKLVAMVTPLCPLCTDVSRMNSSMAQTPSQNQTLHGYVEYNWSYGLFLWFFGLFWPNFDCHGNVLRPLQSEMSSWIGRSRKPPVISNHKFTLSLLEMHLYAFIGILVPKLVAMVTPLCPFCTGVSQMNSPMAQTLSQN